jgi:predicted TIM-barrel fold metal-dependent hydrolase
MSHPIIDFHIHVFDPAVWEPEHFELYGRYQETSGVFDVLDEEKRNHPKGLLALMDRDGIDYCCLITGRYPTNEYTLNFCGGEPRLLPFARCNPNTEPDVRAAARRWVEAGFRGVKLLPHSDHFYVNDERLYPLYEELSEAGLPVLMHIGSSIFTGTKLKYCDPMAVDEVAMDFRRVNFIIAHVGRGLWQDQCFFLSRIHPNLYIEISGLPPAKLLSYFPDFERHAGKIIWGTDWPAVPSMRKNREAIEAFPISPDAKAKILGLNAAKLLSLDAS